MNEWNPINEYWFTPILWRRKKGKKKEVLDNDVGTGNWHYLRVDWVFIFMFIIFLYGMVCQSYCICFWQNFISIVCWQWKGFFGLEPNNFSIELYDFLWTRLLLSLRGIQQYTVLGKEQWHQPPICICLGVRWFMVNLWHILGVGRVKQPWIDYISFSSIFFLTMQFVFLF